jgi:hypothetical protein
MEDCVFTARVTTNHMSKNYSYFVESFFPAKITHVSGQQSSGVTTIDGSEGEILSRMKRGLIEGSAREDEPTAVT